VLREDGEEKDEKGTAEEEEKAKEEAEEEAGGSSARREDSSGLIVHKLYGADVASEIVGEMPKEEAVVCSGHGVLELKQAEGGGGGALAHREDGGVEHGDAEEQKQQTEGKVCRCAVLYEGVECDTPKQVLQSSSPRCIRRTSVPVTDESDSILTLRLFSATVTLFDADEKMGLPAESQVTLFRMWQVSSFKGFDGELILGRKRLSREALPLAEGEDVSFQVCTPLSFSMFGVWECR
jgi:hypothetical protein